MMGTVTHPFPCVNLISSDLLPSIFNPALVFLLCSQGRPEFSEVVTKLEECLCNIEVRTWLPAGEVCVCTSRWECKWGQGQWQQLRTAVALELLEKSKEKWDTTYERER